MTNNINSIRSCEATPNSVWLEFPSGGRECMLRHAARYYEADRFWLEAGWTESPLDLDPRITDDEFRLLSKLTTEQIEALWRRTQ